jgi:hypothetical protein
VPGALSDRPAGAAGRAGGSGASSPLELEVGEGGGGGGSAGGASASSAAAGGDESMVLVLNPSAAALAGQCRGLLARLLSSFDAQAAALAALKGPGEAAGNGAPAAGRAGGKAAAAAGGTAPMEEEEGGAVLVPKAAAAAAGAAVAGGPKLPARGGAAAATAPTAAPAAPPGGGGGELSEARLRAAACTAGIGLQFILSAAYGPDAAALRPLVLEQLQGLLSLQMLSAPGLLQLASDAKRAAVALKYLPVLPGPQCGREVSALSAAGGSPHWSTRAAAVVHLACFWFRHCFLLDPSGAGALEGLVVGLLQDPKVRPGARGGSGWVGSGPPQLGRPCRPRPTRPRAQTTHPPARLPTHPPVYPPTRPPTHPPTYPPTHHPPTTHPPTQPTHPGAPTRPPTRRPTRLPTPQLEVRSVAAATLSGMIRGMPPPEAAALRERLASEAAGLFGPGPGRARRGKGAAPAAPLPPAGAAGGGAGARQHACVQGLKAFVLSSPYDVPMWMPQVLMALVSAATAAAAGAQVRQRRGPSFLAELLARRCRRPPEHARAHPSCTDPAPSRTPCPAPPCPQVKRDASKALSEFRRTHENVSLCGAALGGAGAAPRGAGRAPPGRASGAAPGLSGAP